MTPVATMRPEHDRSELLRLTTIYLVRHAESELNRDKRISGQLESPLSFKGTRESLALRELLREVRLTGIYTSALTRTIETARPTADAHGLPVQARAAFNELHLGVLQGRYRDDRDPDARLLWEARKKDMRHYRVPGGETFMELAHRVIPCLAEILAEQDGGTILIVGHRSTNRVLFGSLMHWPEEEWPRLAFRSKYLYEITPGREPRVATIPLTGWQAGLRYAGVNQ